MAQADIGLYGLGTMGSALALNLADHGFTVAVTNRESSWISNFVDESGPLADLLIPANTLRDIVDSLAPPRTILFMIPSGAPMDAMIKQITPLLANGDTIIDGGNADFRATRARTKALAKSGLHFVGMGVSGGEEGARNGPSMMIGGSLESWSRFKPMAEAIAAKYKGDPCVAHVGTDGAGHFVKTVHNGIEYADMQMIAEVYGILRDGRGWNAHEIGVLLEGWNTGPLQSYLVEISARALQTTDPETGHPMVDVIMDKAGQKGTGRWTVIEALKLGQSASSIEAAIAARSWSSEKKARYAAETLLTKDPQPSEPPSESDLEQALLAGRIVSHAQGFRILQAASDEYNWALDLSRIAEIWRAGCIIRSSLLDDFSVALHGTMPFGHMILTPAMREFLVRSIGPLRRVVAAAVCRGIPVPSLSGALCWHDSLCRARGSTNLIQAQRDLFGAHGFERLDADGKHHGKWS